MPTELSIRVLSSESPLDGCARVVAVALPGSDFGFERSAIGQPPIEALSTQSCNLDFGHIEPAGVLGRAAHARGPASGGPGDPARR
jgi:hypothetical protein